VVQGTTNSMVARRLDSLLGKVDLTGVRQILDIGSWHLGQSIEFAEIFKEASIDAFEPVPSSYKLCRKRRAELNEQLKKRIRVHNIALSDNEGEIPFYAVEPGASANIDPGFSSMFKFMDIVGGNGNGNGNGHTTLQTEIAVQTDKLDNWCEENRITSVDIMWIDAQGAELLVFKGAENILKNTKIIMTEVGLKPYYEGHTLKTDIDAFLFERGFRELEGSFEINIPDYEANVIYVKVG